MALSRRTQAFAIAAIVLLALAVFALLREPKLERAGAIDKLLPSVVRITTHAFVPDDSPGAAPGAMKVQESFGSGFLVDKDGYVVTNRHVINRAYEIIVRLNDGAPIRARLIGHGADIDIALLKLDTSKKLSPVKFGDSNKLSLGDEVIVIGNPFGLGTSVTSGIISAINRDLGLSMFDSFIQTDAPINRGNSGGPIFNMKGQVIGVSTAYYNGGNSNSGSIGLGFAIPSETTVEIVELLKKNGYLKLGWIGVDGATLSPEMINALGLSVNSGAVVSDVRPNSPASTVLVPGDVVLAVDNQPVADMRMLRREVAASLGRSMKLRLMRNGRTETATVVPTEWPGGKMDNLTPREPARDQKGMAMDFGFQCAPMTDDLRAQFKIDGGRRGVVITGVQPNSPAAEIGLQIGDVVESAQLKLVSEPAEIKARIDQALAAKRDFVAMLVSSGGKHKYVSLPLRWEAPPQGVIARQDGG